MTASPLRRFLHRILMGSGPVLLAMVGLYQFVVWQSERLWFESLGYDAQFERIFAWRAGAFGAGALVFGVWLGLNAHLAWRNSAQRTVPLSFFQADDRARLIPLEDRLQLDRYRRPATILVVAGLSWLVGLGCAARSALFVGAFWAQGSGIRDAASNFDLAFFLFTLPCLLFLSRFLLLCILAALLLVAAIYGYEETLNPRRATKFGVEKAELEHGSPRRPPRNHAAATHLAVLWAMLLLWKGLDCVLGVPRSFVSSGGVATRVFDPFDISFGWTSAGLFAFSAPLIALLSGLTIAREPRVRTFALGLGWMFCAAAVPTLLPLVVARSPQTPGWTDALARHIKSTRRAWNLGAVTQRSFVTSPAPPLRSIPAREAAARAPLALWPAAAAQLAFNRRLEERGSDLRVSRVYLERAGDALVYRGLALPPTPAVNAPGANAPGANAPGANAPGDSALAVTMSEATPISMWRARHERAARGLWLQLEAGRAAPDGSPLFLPDAAAPTLFGADPAAGETEARASMRTNSSEADDLVTRDSDVWDIAVPRNLLAGEALPLSNREPHQQISDPAPGVALGDWDVKWLLAARFFDLSIARETKAGDALLWHRGAADRCRQIAPFLDWHEDEARPVLLGADFGAPGTVKWLVPGIVWSDDCPDSAAPQSAAPSTAFSPENARGAASASANYGRQVALGVVDGRSGAVTLYALDGSEPFMALYNRAFPGVFALPTSLPAPIRAEIRPSNALLSAQAQIWSRYHDGDPLSWLAHRADYRPLLLSVTPFTQAGAAPLYPLAATVSGAWDLMPYARPESQAPQPSDDAQLALTASPLAAILGFDERAFAASPAASPFIEWRPRALLPLPALLIETPRETAPQLPGANFKPSAPLPPLLCVAPNLSASGEARGLLVSRGEIVGDAPETGAAPGQTAPLRLKSALQISGPLAPIVFAQSPASSPAEARLQQAREAWRAVKIARQRADWKTVARAEKQLEKVLESPPRVEDKIPGSPRPPIKRAMSTDKRALAKR